MGNETKKRNEKLFWSRGLKFIPIPGDGHCLYNAVSLYFGQDIKTFRKLVACDLEDNIDKYAEFIVLPGGISIEDYIANIRNGNEWAGDLEITVLSKLLNRPIIAIKANMQIINKQILDIGLNNEEPIFVYYNNINHYDGLVLREGYNSRLVLDHLNNNSFKIKDRKKEAKLIRENTFLRNLWGIKTEDPGTQRITRQRSNTVDYGQFQERRAPGINQYIPIKPGESIVARAEDVKGRDCTNRFSRFIFDEKRNPKGLLKAKEVNKKFSNDTGMVYVSVNNSAHVEYFAQKRRGEHLSKAVDKYFKFKEHTTIEKEKLVEQIKKAADLPLDIKILSLSNSDAARLLLSAKPQGPNDTDAAIHLFNTLPIKIQNKILADDRLSIFRPAGKASIKEVQASDSNASHSLLGLGDDTIETLKEKFVTIMKTRSRSCSSGAK